MIRSLLIPTLSAFIHAGEHLDILAISCDSFDEDVNRKIGRHHPKERHLNIIRRVRDWCTKYRVAFKVNTVVNSYNKNEDMSEAIIELNPIRWKVRRLFQLFAFVIVLAQVFVCCLTVN